MDVSRIRALRGPNLWGRHTAIEAIVTCSEAEQDIAKLNGFETNLRALFPAIPLLQIAGHDEPVPLAHALQVTALCLQSQAGCPVTFSRTQATVEHGVYQVVVEYSEESVGRKAFDLARQLCDAALHDKDFDLAAALAELHELDEDERLGPSTGAIVQAAVARGIPTRRLTRGSLVQFGWGSKQRRIQAAETDRSSAIAESIAQDKELTKKLLAAAGVPVPVGRPAANADDAWAALCEIGAPVVVKPLDGNQGKGVTVNVVTREQLDKAYASATAISDDVLVEKFIPGSDFRLLVVGNQVVAASRRDPPQVIGDGVHSVRELVEEVNTDPRRGIGHATSLTKIRIDEIALAQFVRVQAERQAAKINMMASQWRMTGTPRKCIDILSGVLEKSGDYPASVSKRDAWTTVMRRRPPHGVPAALQTLVRSGCGPGCSCQISSGRPWRRTRGRDGRSSRRRSCSASSSRCSSLSRICSARSRCRYPSRHRRRGG